VKRSGRWIRRGPTGNPRPRVRQSHTADLARAGLYVDAYANAYFKQNNLWKNDWSDLMAHRVAERDNGHHARVCFRRATLLELMSG